MNIIDSLAARLGYVKAERQAEYPPVMLRAAEAEKWSMPDMSLYQNQAELYQRLSWVFIAVSTVAQLCATVPLSVKKLRGERTKDVPNHPFELLLRRPNPSQSRLEFIRASISYYLLTGNCYWHLSRASETAEIDELWVIPPHMIEPVPDGRQFIRGYKYDTGEGTPTLLPPWSVAHFREFHPNSVFAGLSRVEPVATVSTGDLAMQKWNAELFGKNNARLPGILGFKDAITDPDWEVIKRDIQNASKDRQFVMFRNFGNGVTWMQAAATLKDMEFMSGRTFTKEEIFNVFAPGLSSILAVNATEANARTGKATLIEMAVWPLLVSIAEKVTNDVLPAYAGGSKQLQYIAEFDDIRVTDRALELQEQAEYAKSHTIDEIREKYYEDAPLADATGEEDDKRGLLLPAQIGPTTPAPGDEPEPEPVPLDMPPAATPQDEQPGEGMGEEDDNPEADMEEAMREDMAKWECKALKRLRAGKGAACDFESEYIPAGEMERIRAGLVSVETAEQVKAVFAGSVPEAPPPDSMAALVAELKRANDLLERTEVS